MPFVIMSRTFGMLFVKKGPSRWSSEEIGSAVASRVLHHDACEFGMIGMLITSKPHLAQ